jgi:serine O-acetyltransferase
MTRTTRPTRTLTALGARLARRLAREDMPRDRMEPLLTGVFEANPLMVHSAARDLLAMFERDPACFSPLEPLLFFKGFLDSSESFFGQNFLNVFSK